MPFFTLFPSTTNMRKGKNTPLAYPIQICGRKERAHTLSISAIHVHKYFVIGIKRHIFLKYQGKWNFHAVMGSDHNLFRDHVMEFWKVGGTQKAFITKFSLGIYIIPHVIGSPTIHANTNMVVSNRFPKKRSISWCKGRL